MFSRPSNSTRVPKPRDADNCRECALRLLDQRAHSEHELRTKLRQRQFPIPIIQEILNDFRRLKLVDDLAFARLLIEQKQRGNLAAGRMKIMQELRKRGIPQEIIPELEIEFFTGEDAQADELARATELITRKLAHARRSAIPANPREARLANQKAEASLLRFLAARGFSGTIARQALATACQRE